MALFVLYYLLEKSLNNLAISIIGSGSRENINTIFHCSVLRITVLNTSAIAGTEITPTCKTSPSINAPTRYMFMRRPDFIRE